MFIRKKLNRGGSYSVVLATGERVPGKKHPVSRIIKNFGSSTDKNRIDEMVKEAEAYKAQLMRVSPKAKTLKIVSSDDIQSCHSFTVGFLDVYGREYDKVFKDLSLTPAYTKHLRELAMMRIARPDSKRGTALDSSLYGASLQIDSIYKLMDRMNDSVIDQIKSTIYHHTSSQLALYNEPLDVLFYDLTTLSFETGTQDEYRDFGFSKDGKHHHVQIVLAVIVTKDGLPVDYTMFPGNCYEGHTLIPVLKKLKETYAIQRVVLVADAALMNKVNLSELESHAIDYVIAARIKNTTKTLQKEILDYESYQPISTTQTNDGIDIIASKTIPHPEGGTMVAYYSSKRARKDNFDREKNIQKVEKNLYTNPKKSLSSKFKKPYISVSSDIKIVIDEDKINQDQLFDGFFAFQTNMKTVNPQELLSMYRGLWQVEQTFRIAKSSLEIRPVFHFTPKRIKAHIALCYMSLALVRFIEFTLKKNTLHTPFDQLHDLLSRIRIARIKDSQGNTFDLLENAPTLAPKIYNILNIPWYKKFAHIPEL